MLRAHYSNGKKVSAMISVRSRVRVRCSRGEDTAHVPIINVPDAASQPHLTWLSFLPRSQVKEPPRFLAPCPRWPAPPPPRPGPYGHNLSPAGGVLVMCTDGASCHPLMISTSTYTLMDLAASLKQITLIQYFQHYLWSIHTQSRCNLYCWDIRCILSKLPFLSGFLSNGWKWTIEITFHILVSTWIMTRF